MVEMVPWWVSGHGRCGRRRLRRADQLEPRRHVPDGGSQRWRTTLSEFAHTLVDVAFATEHPVLAHSEFRPVCDIPRSDGRFKVVSDYQPAGDQPAAIDELERRIKAGEKDVVLLGATGTGKSRDHGVADRAAAAADAGDGAEQDARRAARQRAARALPAQRGRVLRLLLRLLPARGVRPADGHLHREGLLDQRRRGAAAALGDDVPAVPPRRDRGGASVSCIYGLGTPQSYLDRSCRLAVGEQMDRDTLLRALVDIQYARNDLAFTRGTFRVRGDTVEIIPAYEELAIRIEFFGDEIEKLYYLHPLTGDIVREVDEVRIFPATHYVAGPERMEKAIDGIEAGARTSGSPSWRSRASCWRRSGCGCAPTTTSR